VVVIALLAAGTALLGVLAFTTGGGSGPDTDGRAALKAATAEAVVVLSYDYRHLSADFAKALALTTGPFNKEYQNTSEKVVTDLAARYHAVVVAEVSAGSVERVTGKDVTLLMFINQKSDSTLSSATKITTNRVEMVMTRVHGRWLVKDVTAY
jgi:Mce-associated membrane protein